MSFETKAKKNTNNLTKLTCFYEKKICLHLYAYKQNKKTS